MLDLIRDHANQKTLAKVLEKDIKEKIDFMLDELNDVNELIKQGDEVKRVAEQEQNPMQRHLLELAYKMGIQELNERKEVIKEHLGNLHKIKHMSEEGRFEEIKEFIENI